MKALTITLCGSARFEPWFHTWNKALTLAGHDVFSLSCFPSVQGSREWYTPEQKVALDQAHRRKIAKSDAVVFLNVFAYLGPSSLVELAFAREIGKDVYFLETWGNGNGITRRHDDETRAAARLYDAYEVGSPVDTHRDRDVWSSDLLGPGSAYRSSLVALIKAEHAAACLKRTL